MVFRFHYNEILYRWTYIYISVVVEVHTEWQQSNEQQLTKVNSMEKPLFGLWVT